MALGERDFQLLVLVRPGVWRGRDRVELRARQGAGAGHGRVPDSVRAEHVRRSHYNDVYCRYRSQSYSPQRNSSG